MDPAAAPSALSTFLHFFYEEGSSSIFLLVSIIFGGTLLSAHYYLIDSLVCMGVGFLGFRAARVSQMVTQYRWINRPDGPLRWRRQAP